MNIPSLPRSNKGAALGAVLYSIGILALQGWWNFVQTGQPFPMNAEGWARLITNIVVGAIIAVLIPRGSITEALRGYRTVNPPPDGADAPVVEASKIREMERPALRKESEQT